MTLLFWLAYFIVAVYDLVMTCRDFRELCETDEVDKELVNWWIGVPTLILMSLFWPITWFVEFFVYSRN